MTPARDSLKRISGEFARATFEELDWDEKDGESDDDRERRTTALSLMIYSEDKEVLDEAKRVLTAISWKTYRQKFEL